MVDPNVETTTLEPGSVPRTPGSATEVIAEEGRGSSAGLWIALAIGGALAAVLLLAVVGVAGLGMYSWTTIQPGSSDSGNDEPIDVVKPAVAQVGANGGKAVSAGPLVKSLRVKHWMNDEARPWVDIGNGSSAAAFGDNVRIEVEFREPVYAYLIGFNADGKEQLLMPVTERMEWKTDAEARPMASRSLEFPHPDRAKFTEGNKPAVWKLDDEERGGTQAFAVAASRKPLPSYEEWKKTRGKAAWKYDPVCIGVHGCQGGKLTTILAGLHVQRGKESVLQGVPPLVALCASLKKGGVEEVEAIAFMVKPKAKE